MQATNLSLLLKQIEQSFNNDELRLLCYDLGINYENLPGETRSQFARELILHCQRTGRLSDLIQVCRELRPNASWPSLSDFESDAEIKIQEVEPPLNRIQKVENEILSKVANSPIAEETLVLISKLSRTEDEHFYSLNQLEKIISRQPKNEVRPSFFRQIFNKWYEPEGSKNDVELFATSLSFLASTFRSEGQSQLALDYLEAALRFWQSCDNYGEEAKTLGSIGNIYRDTGNIYLAKDYYEKSIHIYGTLSDDLAEGNALQNLSSMLLAETDDLDATLDILNQQERIWKKLEDKPGIFVALNNKGTVFSKLRNVEEAQKSFDEALQIAIETGNLQDETSVLLNKASLAARLSDWKNSKIIYERIFEIYESLDDYEGALQTLESISETYINMGEPENALIALQQAIEYQKSIGRFRLEASNSRIEQKINKLSLELSNNVNSLNHITSFAQNFFKEAGFVLATTNQLNSFICLPNKSSWSRKFKGDVFTKIIQDEVIDDECILSLRDAASEFSENSDTAFLIVNQPIKDEAWLQIATLRLSNFRIIPIPISIFNEGKLTTSKRNERFLLSSHLERFLGKEYDPYDVRSPVSDVLNFFGREATAQELNNKLIGGHPIGLFGLRKIGKSSLMRYMQQSIAYPTAWIDLQAGVDRLSIYNRILKSWQNSTKNKFDFDLGLSDLKLESNEPDLRFFELTSECLSNLEEAKILPEPRLIIFLDEIELITPPLDAKGIELENYLSLMKTLRALVQEDGRVSIMVAGVDPFINQVSRWGNVQNPFFKLLQEEYLSPLHTDDCIQMIRNIGRQVELSYTDQTLKLITEASGCHPFLARQICSLAFNLNQRKPSKISELVVHQALEQFVYEPKYSSFLGQTGLWGEISNQGVWGKEGAAANQAILVFISKANSAVNREELMKCHENRSALQTAFYRLQEISIIQQSAENSNNFNLTFGIFKAWVRRVYLGLRE